jgi:hypothetical protein
MDFSKRILSKNMYKNIYVICYVLCLISLACSEELKIKDLGIIDQEIIVSDMQINEDQDGIENNGCQNDTDCSSSSYCLLDKENFQGQCTSGCRINPDSCAIAGSRKRCSVETRTCELTCTIDQECFVDQRCDNNLCVLGCRVNDPQACPMDNNGLRYCNPSTFECNSAIVCCDLDSQCSFTQTQSCEQVGGEVMLGVNSCQPSPCRAQCTHDSLCPTNEYCADYGRCAIGCRLDTIDSCPNHLYCDENTRQCLPKNCSLDSECEAWQYCSETRICTPGCRVDSCMNGQSCNMTTHLCESQCMQDQECDDGYCVVEQGVCRSFCDEMTHEGCDLNEACINQRCVVTCIDDNADLIGDDQVEQAYLITWEDSSDIDRDQLRSSTLLSRVLCPMNGQIGIADEDWYQMNLLAGDRLRIQVHRTLQNGDIIVNLYNENLQLLTMNEAWQERNEITYPELLREGISQDQNYFIQVKSDLLLDRSPYTLQISAAPAYQACFDDDLDPGDDTLQNARRIGTTPALQFSESYTGNLCLADEDFYCFAMNSTDGLDVFLDTMATCDPLQVDLAPSAIFTLEEDRFEGYRLPVLAEEGVWGDEGGKRYQILLDQENSSFTQDEWCIRVRNTVDSMCENYRLSTVFSRRQLICSDLREPNNTIQQATPLDGNGPLANAQGEIPYDQTLLSNNYDNLFVTLNENLYLCTDDYDTFSVQTVVGDVWRAWIIDHNNSSDNDLNNPEEQSRNLKIRFIDENGTQIGDEGSLNPSIMNDLEQYALQQATVVTSFNGPLWIQIFGVDQSKGAYRLFIQRTPNQGVCTQDVNEPIGGDQELNPVSQLREEDEQRFSINQGYLCDAGTGADEDWYAFEITQNQTRLCLSSSFRHANGDINIELFENDEVNQGEECQVHADCRTNQAASSCILGYCRLPIEHAQSQDDGEFIHFSPFEGRIGNYYARVYSPDQAENTYRLNVTLLPTNDQCTADYHEGVQGNNRSQNATPLGSGRIQLCDTWICDSEREQGDWFEITIPAFATRSIHTRFENQQGRIILSAEDVSTIGGQIVDSPRNQNRNVHCINIVAGERAATIRLHIAGDVFYNQQNRIDYILQVLASNIDNGSQGACNALNGGIFDNVIWPIMDLR